MVDIEKAKKGFKCCSAANADRVCFEFECPYKNQDPHSEKCCIDEMLDNGLEAIEQLEKTVEDQVERIAIMEAEMQGWISVDEKLPDEYTNVLVVADGKVLFCQMWVYGNGEKHFTLSGVTHWMPLPKPPKECDHDYEQASYYRDYCEKFESTYNPEDGSM